MTTTRTRPAPGLPRPPVARSAARRDVLLFLVTVAALVAALQTVVITDGRSIEQQPGAIVLMMWAPGLVSLVLRMLLREGTADISLRPRLRSAWRWYALSLALPPLVAILAYGAAWASGLVATEPGTTATSLGLALLAVTVMVPISAVTALGEELGWRGYLLPRLSQAGSTQPVLLTNLVWVAFHAGLVLAGLYASGPSPLLATLVFGASVTAIGTVAGWSRLATASVWPAVLLHATWNSVIQGVFDPASQGSGPRAPENLWVGESGLLVAAAALVLGIPLAAGLRHRERRKATSAATTFSNGAPV